jgi:hypothetical protein
MGRVTRAGERAPLAGSQVAVRPVASPGSEHVFVVDREGQYRVEGLVPGRYEFMFRAMGFRARRDTLTLAPNVTMVRDAELAEDRNVLGETPPDTALVARMRARRAEWGCLLDSATVAAGKQSWAETLGDAPLLQDAMKLRGDTAYFERLIVPVGDRRVCRRAAAAFDRVRGAASLTTLVYRAGPFYLVSQPSEHTIIFDRAWRVVYYFFWE